MNRERFTALWVRCLDAGQADDAEEVFSMLLNRYCEAHRKYHTPQHIVHCLEQFDKVSSQTEQPDAVELAIWFHDIIYDIPSIENELKSAELFLELTKGRINPDLGQSVYDMILITTHKTKPIRYDDKLLVDIDLSSFALPWEQFRQDSQHVREEFSNKTDQEFYSGHVKFLQSLLDKPRFFASEFFCTEFEVDARKNIEKLLKQLHGDGLS